MSCNRNDCFEIVVFAGIFVFGDFYLFLCFFLVNGVWIFIFFRFFFFADFFFFVLLDDVFFAGIVVGHNDGS